MVKRKSSLGRPKPNSIIGKSFRDAGQKALRPKNNVLGNAFSSTGSAFKASLPKPKKRS